MYDLKRNLKHLSNQISKTTSRISIKISIGLSKIKRKHFRGNKVSVCLHFLVIDILVLNFVEVEEV